MIDKINPPHYQQGKDRSYRIYIRSKIKLLETVLNIFVVINLRMD